MIDFPQKENLSYSDGQEEDLSYSDGQEEDLSYSDGQEEDLPYSDGQEGEEAEPSLPKASASGQKAIRILGLDYGSKTVGVALSDPLGLTAQPIETIKREQENKLRRTLARITELCAQYKVTEIVLGLPKNLDNSLGTRAEWTLAFGEKVKARTGLPVRLWDERLSTNQADRVLELSGVHKKDRKAHLDQMAAAIILQSYLDANIH